MRAQERQPCRRCSGRGSYNVGQRGAVDVRTCFDCGGTGTRWVTVGTLHREVPPYGDPRDADLYAIKGTTVPCDQVQYTVPRLGACPVNLAVRCDGCNGDGTKTVDDWVSDPDGVRFEG